MSVKDAKLDRHVYITQPDLRVYPRERGSHVARSAAKRRKPRVCHHLRISVQPNDHVSMPYDLRVFSPMLRKFSRSEVAHADTELGVPHVHSNEVQISSDQLNLRDYLTRKRSIQQITPQYHCKQLISAMLSYCHCGFQMTRPSVFSRLSNVSATSLSKRRRLRKKKATTETKYHEVTFNMTSAGKNSTLSFEESDAEYTLRVKELLQKLDGIYQNTRIRIWTISLVDYKKLAKGLSS